MCTLQSTCKKKLVTPEENATSVTCNRQKAASIVTILQYCRKCSSSIKNNDRRNLRQRDAEIVQFQERLCRLFINQLSSSINISERDLSIHIGEVLSRMLSIARMLLTSLARLRASLIASIRPFRSAWIVSRVPSIMIHWH